MVFDWFRRNLQPQPAAPEEPAVAPEPAEAPEEPAVAPSPAVAELPAAPPAAAPTASAPPQEAPSREAASDATSQDALEWARQAYARLKAEQEAARLQNTQAAPEQPAPSAPTEPSPAALEPEPSPAAGPSLLEQAAARRAERQQALTAPPVPDAAPDAAPAAEPAVERVDSAEPRLGAFDDTFTWSAEVLAAQGRRIDQVSLEEIDWLGRLRQGLEKTRRGFVTQLLDSLGDDPLSPELLDDLETALLRADVGVSATDRVLEALRQRLNEEVVESAEGLRFLKDQLRSILEGPIETSGVPLLAPQKGRLNVWLMVGVNGVGKTTTLGKLANLAVRSGYSCLIAAADTFRAAAVQQVQAWGDRSQVPVIANPSANADPAAVVYDAIGAAQAKGTELVLVDTAGRLQTKHNLMEELTKVRRIIDRLAPEAAVESLLVLDASQGQNGLRQAMAFASAAGLTGVVITKLDGSARGGVALAVASEAGLPIRFIGAGEGIRDLRPFNSFEFVEALLAG
ncbi:signal recognition particle-docking protein FtsY [Cyanobium sp. ATX 6A2]|uniref:signal recognition particle-docking protein FtsY n=1 Tax=Cyanobium sp. ATX 6A2 TaxID=2823700 RepID=UPI0020CF2C3A|nr:signal recognition particle-docking protein FtsY [Cyanobium sp. ATX 6A2]MCP9886897.1 signal recognition particle-docking protein FtsY [Cyanobium sp. ATX 6A2]